MLHPPLQQEEKFLSPWHVTAARVFGGDVGPGDIRVVLSQASISRPLQVRPTPPPRQGTVWPRAPGCLVSLRKATLRATRMTTEWFPPRVQKVKDKGWLRLPHSTWRAALCCIWRQTPWVGSKSCWYIPRMVWPKSLPSVRVSHLILK